MVALRTILVPVDFSPHAERALEYAIELASRTDGRLHLLHSVPAELFNVVAYGPAYPSELPPDYQASMRRQARTRMDALRERAEQHGLPVDVHLSELFPSEAILRTADEVGADLIVMGTRGLTGLRHVVLGSIAERTVRMAPCPVLTVKVEEAA